MVDIYTSLVDVHGTLQATAIETDILRTTLFAYDQVTVTGVHSVTGRGGIIESVSGNTITLDSGSVQDGKTIRISTPNASQTGFTNTNATVTAKNGKVYTITGVTMSNIHKGMTVTQIEGDQIIQTINGGIPSISGYDGIDSWTNSPLNGSQAFRTWTLSQNQFYIGAGSYKGAGIYADLLSGDERFSIGDGTDGLYFDNGKLHLADLDIDGVETIQAGGYILNSSQYWGLHDGGISMAAGSYTNTLRFWEINPGYTLKDVIDGVDGHGPSGSGLAVGSLSANVSGNTYQIMLRADSPSGAGNKIGTIRFNSAFIENYGFPVYKTHYIGPKSGNVGAISINGTVIILSVGTSTPRINRIDLNVGTPQDGQVITIHNEDTSGSIIIDSSDNVGGINTSNIRCPGASGSEVVVKDDSCMDFQYYNGYWRPKVF